MFHPPPPKKPGLILLATTITVSVTIPLFSALAGGLYVVSAVMLSLYLPAANELKRLRMGTAGASCCLASGVGFIWGCVILAG